MIAATARSKSGGTRVVGYARASTERQAEVGVSLDAQRAKITAYAEQHKKSRGERTGNIPYGCRLALASVRAAASPPIIS